MTNLVTIVNGYYNRKIINGTFQAESEFKPYSPNNFKTGYAKPELGYNGTIYVQMEGKRREVHVNEKELVVSNGTVVMGELAAPATPVVHEIDIDALSEKIFARFNVLDISCQGVINYNMRGLVVSGAPGVGKTYTFENELKEAVEDGRIGNFKHLKGKVTPLVLYETLFHYSQAGDVILLDDTDDIFFDETSMNILKAALDTSSGFVSYGSTTKYLEDNDIPRMFPFQGSIVFITNYDFDRIIKADNSRLIPHFKALMSRTTYLDLKIHSKLEIMIRVEQVALDSRLLETLNVDPQTAEKMVKWCWDNYENMREISIRTLHKLAEYSKMGDWVFLAENFLLLD